MLTVKGRRYDTGEPVAIRIIGDRIAGIDPAWPRGGVEQWPYVAPGLFDLQINGHNGIWYSDPRLTPEQVIETLAPHFAFGVTRLLPTLITASYEALAAGFTAIRQACEQAGWVELMVPGCHLEGPYISP
jgi:N-acetylglucosamine-6-phosphate deacetylase